MLQQYNSLVVDASFINKNFVQVSVIGKGLDFYLGISSISYLMHHKKEQGRYILQTYENLGHDLFRTKVGQLQKAMLECVNDVNTRIILLAEKQLNDKQSDLLVLYQLNELNKRLDQQEQLNPQQAEQLLITFCQNLLITGRVTYEFLDLAPQNIYVEENRFVISNMGISYKGSKFHRPYTPITDNFYKEKTLKHMMHTYSFQAGLVVLCAITKINSAEFFFEDGQLKSNLLQDVLKLFKENQPDLEKQKIKLKKQFASLAKVEKPFDANISKIIPFLSLILSLDQQKRSIFSLLICHPENPLKVENPFFQQALDVEQQYVGFGKLDGVKIVPHGYGHGKFGKEYHYGMFSNGVLTDDGTIEIRVQNSIIYILKNLIISQKYQNAVAELNKHIFWGEFDNKSYKPNGQCLLLYEINTQKHLNKKRQSSYFEGILKQGIKQDGQEFLKNKTEFDGTYLNNQPAEGKIVYGPKHVFDGIIQNYQRVKGILVYKNQVFTGEFEKDRVKEGVINYSDGSEYEGQLKDGLKCSQEGKFRFWNHKIEYSGGFLDDEFHGKGMLTILQNNEQLEVEYNKGKCLTEIPEAFKQLMQKKQMQEVKKQSDGKKKDQQQKEDEDDGGIEEDIQDDVQQDDNDFNEEEG
ncbi:unnamed protein product (macronuclear) [Paramecium tetraurelia]|uniref:Protein kinase domain-containing protein n=1 Tax=Paramecium tetraurelia TaxID=5888 RepID=A0C627_PARTE|nr:uncharacterized protein GSPATT00035373001 [Paramecium tetraurelia]CAK66244.1 unnamed protein product [Paramecium tetraurelia]|eukprot:XP_001433641.1 hypothetical protein (macronuclear) [Paramecium tetraurelia strain d4-2]